MGWADDVARIAAYGQSLQAWLEWWQKVPALHRVNAWVTTQGPAPDNMAVQRRVTHTLLCQNITTKLGIADKRRLAGWNLAYMEEILGM